MLDNQSCTSDMKIKKRCLLSSASYIKITNWLLNRLIRRLDQYSETLEYRSDTYGIENTRLSSAVVKH